MSSERRISDGLPPNLLYRQDIRICKHQDECKDFGSRCGECDNNKTIKKQSFFEPIEQSKLK